MIRNVFNKKRVYQSKHFWLSIPGYLNIEFGQFYAQQIQSLYVLKTLKWI